MAKVFIKRSACKEVSGVHIHMYDVREEKLPTKLLLYLISDMSEPVGVHTST